MGSVGIQSSIEGGLTVIALQNTGNITGLGLATVSIIFTGILTSCTPASLVEQGIERELPRYVGPADSYSVDIEGLRVKEGTAENVVAVGERVRPEGAPVIERLALELEGVEYDRTHDKLRQVAGARLTAVIKTPDLVTFLEAYRDVREAQVMLRSPNEATIRLRPQIGGLAVPRGITVDVSGQLIGDRTQLRFDVDEVSAGGIDLSAIAASRLSEVINPLADLENLPVDVEITSVIVAGESIGLEVIGNPSSFEL